MITWHCVYRDFIEASSREKAANVRSAVTEYIERNKSLSIEIHFDPKGDLISSTTHFENMIHGRALEILSRFDQRIAPPEVYVIIIGLDYTNIYSLHYKGKQSRSSV